MRRREFIAALGGTVAWPLVARAQQTKPKRLGWLVNGSASDPAPILPVSTHAYPLPTRPVDPCARRCINRHRSDGRRRR